MQSLVIPLFAGAWLTTGTSLPPVTLCAVDVRGNRLVGTGLAITMSGDTARPSPLALGLGGAHS